MTPNNLIKYILFFSCLGTFLTNGILMIKEKNLLNFSELNKNQDFYVGILIYTEIFLGLITFYNILFYIYKYFYKCCNDNEITSSFSLFKMIFLLSGIVSHITLFYYLIKHKYYIDENIQHINIIFCSNFIFNFFIILFINIYKNCKKNTENEKLIT